ncbi:MAG: DUF4190 domain-containing protein [Eubacterium sp.]|nr:DUF4190 domain-containing protein [Eubacterium sp.]MCM1303244.1 DUF4190 domain-containing protein [Butyrivibrio sp.]MCM1343209.1 DUF4190 domain-containing protein [Muribaculaceae bacterium]MCM1409559.1 DUF4190 domain-containing protein [Lachnospiraceae bacterium]
MDYNQNDQNSWQRDDQQRDRWNSSASNSSYYNQPTHRPYGQGFIIASMVCGVLSVTACCTGILSLPLGALGILFALLTYRKGKKMNGSALTGIVLSTMGIVTGVSILVYSFRTLPDMMRDPMFRSQMDAIMEQMYGMDLEEFMREYYGYELDVSE